MTETVNFHIPYHYDKDTAQRAINMREIERMVNNIINGDVSVGGGSGSWADWSPVLSTTAGSITSQTCTGRYTTINGTVFYTAACLINTLGTGSTELLMTLPADVDAPKHVGNGKDVGTANLAVILYATNNTQATIYTTAGAFPGVTGANFKISGFYEPA